MKITAFDLVHLLDGVERVSASKIPDAQKTLVLTELRNAVQSQSSVRLVLRPEITFYKQ